MSAPVLIIMGSPTDVAVAREVAGCLKELGLSFEVRVASAHRTPEKAMTLAQEAEKAGVLVLIAIAGKAAALPGLLAAKTSLPVIGVPVSSPELAGLDALTSMTQLPKGTPVATMGLGLAGAYNAGLLAGRIAALSRPEVRERLKAMTQRMAESVEEGDQAVQDELNPIRLV